MPDNNTPFVITIGRQIGSGGEQISRALADTFHIAYYDKDILSQAAEGTGLGRNIFAHPEDRHSKLRYFLGAVQPFIGGGDFYAHQLSDENIFKLQSGVIQKIATERSSIFVGRVADSILANHPRMVRIFIAANMEDRVRRVMDEKKVDYRNAVRCVEENDELRANYYNFYSSGTWGNAESYDLTINTSALGVESSIEFIKQFVCKKLDLCLPEEEGTIIPEMF